MKHPISVFVMSCSLFAVGIAPASASTVLYDNGPANGNLDAWGINFGYGVSDSFHLSTAATVTGADFYTWVYPADSLTSVDWSISSDPLGGGTVYESGTATATGTFLSTKDYGFNLFAETIAFPSLDFGAGSYWLTLQNAVVVNGNPIYWDQNDGPSAAWLSGLGNLNTSGYPCSGACTFSEAFQITGDPLGGGQGGAVPEPASFGLLGLEIVGIASLMRKRIKR